MAHDFPLLFLHGIHDTRRYKPPAGRGDFKTPERDSTQQYESLHRQFQAMLQNARFVWDSSRECEGVTPDGIYLEFSSSAGFPLKVDSIESRQFGIRLRNMKSEGSDDSLIQSATLFFPREAVPNFAKKLTEYHTKVTKKGAPQNAPLVNSIENINTANLSAFWTDSLDLIPSDTTAEWCEIWLDIPNVKGNDAEFRDIAKTLGITLDEGIIRFPDRAVLLGRTTRVHLKRLVSTCSNIAEFRRAKETARFFLESDNRHQAEWMKDIAGRIKVLSGTDVSVCVLDTGANNGHLLLQPVLDSFDCHVVNPKWRKDDTDGHGTGMCGMAVYGDLVDVALSSGPIVVEHLLESVKILSKSNPNEPGNYGDITIRAISQAEIQAPKRKRINCMAVTASDTRDRGRPSSWSGAIDAVLSGSEDEERRIMFIAAGNARKEDVSDYPHSNTLPENSIHDPGQSWNAITVGAYTTKNHISDPTFRGFQPIAQGGELSPSSTTSASWNTDWPAKPDIVLEGGNYAKGPDGTIDTPDDLLLLTTGNKPFSNQFGWLNATSAATALAAKMAAEIQVRYPSAWPETIRGLMIHSAQWTDKLKRQFLSLHNKDVFQKQDYAQFLRFCGYGVPDRTRALDCAKNTLTLISQTTIKPFAKSGSDIVFNDVHFYSLPWPKDSLLALGEKTVTLRVTLSYFIEPAPGTTGKKNRYQYASHLLRFDVNKENETDVAFRNRINHAAQTDDSPEEPSSGGSRDWVIGPHGRDKGSIHSDMIETSAASLATRNLIAVYPKGGWWKTRPHLNRWQKSARYSLIVSITTEEQSVDIYTPVAIQLSTPIPVQL